MTSLAYYESHPWFFDSWKVRHERHKNVIICATGQSLGIGKSYFLLSAFEKIDPDFTVEKQVVFIPKQFWEAVDSLPATEWHPILWDDPTRGLQKRDWYKDVNKTVTSFMKTSSRYKRKDLGFAVPTFDDLDIAIREIMTLEAQMKEPGLSKIHRIKRNRFGTPPFWKPYLGEVQLHVPKQARAYEKKREEFHQMGYTEKEFGEEKPYLSKVDSVYEQIKTNPLRYIKIDPYRKPKLSARMVAGLLGCSDQTARNAIIRIETLDSELLKAEADKLDQK